jgi:hypothetical protein
MRLLAEKGIQFLTNLLAVIFDDLRWRKMCRATLTDICIQQPSTAMGGGNSVKWRG